MMEVVIEHMGISSLPVVIPVLREIDPRKSPGEICQIITSSIPENFKRVELTCEPTILVTDGTGKDSIFDVDRMRRDGFSNMIGHNQRLKFSWNVRKSTEPSQKKSAYTASMRIDILLHFSVF